MKLGYALNKQEFEDAIALCYNYKIQEMAHHFSCGTTYSLDHALVYRLGGFTIMPHNTSEEDYASVF